MKLPPTSLLLPASKPYGVSIAPALVALADEVDRRTTCRHSVEDLNPDEH